MTILQGILCAVLVGIAAFGLSRRREGLSIQGPAVAFAAVFLALAISFMWTNPRMLREAAGERESAASTRRDERRDDAFELHRQKKYPKAIAIYDEILRASPKDAEILFWRGIAHWRFGNTDQALADFRSVAAIQPGNFDAIKYADQILARQRRWDEIIALWDAYLRVVPNDVEGYYERGGTHYHKGDRQAAIRDYNRACQMGKAKVCEFVKWLETLP